MQELNIRYAFILFPLIYVLIPFILSGSFIILGGIGLLAFLTGVIIFVIISNLDLGGNADVLTSGVGFNIGLSDEGSYSLFVVFIGGLFYLGASLAQFLAPIFDIFVTILNALIGVVGFLSGLDVSAFQTTLISNLGGSVATNLGTVYPTSITIAGISVFLTLDVIFASMFILGLYFMISSRGQ
jgi:hypothetical protein